MGGGQLAQAALENLNFASSIRLRKESATEMENFLGDTFRRKKWSVHVVNDKEANVIRNGGGGDVDVIVSDGKDTLLIQLKRTKFRLDLKESYNEASVVDKKAYQQLNGSEHFLRKGNDVFSLKGNVHKWLVTTSYETILTSTDGCLKLNYFDLIHTLNEAKDIFDIKELIRFINEDEATKIWLKALRSGQLDEIEKDLVLDCGLPLPIVEPIKYNQPLFANNEGFKNYHNRFNNALELGGNDEKLKAIAILNSCLHDNPNDYEVWSALGNFYADIKDYKNAFACFDKALEIMPNDPFIKRNYAIAHREKGDVLTALKYYKEIQEDYWFLHVG